MATLKHGYLEKESKGYITSKWSMRWCVLTSTNLKFYTEPNLTQLKGTFPMNYYTRITRKAPDGSGKYQILIENTATKDEVVLAATDLATLSSWEEAISKVILSQSKPALEGVRRSAVDTLPREFITEKNDDSFDEPTPGTMSLDLQAVIGQSASIIRSGYLQKQGHIVQSWKKRWFVLTSTTLAYFTSDKMTELKGMIKLSQYSYVCHENPNSSERLFPISLWTNGGGSRINLLMNATDEVSSLQWESSLCSVILKHKHVEHPLAVRVSIVSEIDAFPITTLDQIYILQLYIGGESVSREYHHFADIKDFFSNLRQVSPSVIFAQEFPRTYKRSSFGVSLGVEEIENRRFQLECWLQELIEKYHEFDYLSAVLGTSTGNDIQTGIAQLFGLTNAELVLHIDSFFSSGTKDEFAELGSLKNQTETKSSLSKLFGSTANDPSDPPNHDSRNDCTEQLNDDQNILSMPDDPDELKTKRFYQLAQFCKLKRIDCRNFKAKKYYVKALLETYRQQLPYLHGKDASTEIKRISKQIEGKEMQYLEPQVVMEIDNIFVDLLRKLRVSESMIPILNVEYHSLEKFSRISQCVSIWDKEGDFLPEDEKLLSSLLSDTSVNIFILLTIKFRISKSSAANEWLHRFSFHQGVTVLLTVMNRLLEQIPLLSFDATALIIIIQSFRLIMERECRDVLIESTGTFDAVVRCLIYDFKPLVLEVIDFLYECILYGGRNAPWLIMSSFRSCGKKMNQKPYQILIDGIQTGDITVQSGVISLINSLMLYEPELKEKLDFRMSLLSVDLENVCKGYVREYQKLMMGKASESNPEEEKEKPQDNPESDDPSFIFPTYTRRLRAGIRINDLDMAESISDEANVTIHPAKGLMEGYAIEILEKEEEQKMYTPVNPTSQGSRNRSASLMGFPTYNYLNVAPTVFGIGKFARRLSATNVPTPARKAIAGASPSTELLRETVGARRLWYRIDLKGKELLWYSSFDDRHEHTVNKDENPSIVGRMSFLQVKDVVDYSTLPSRINFPLQNCITFVTEDHPREPKYYHLSFDTLETKHKWLVALSFARKSLNYHRSPYHLPSDSPMKSSVTIQLRNNFEKQVTLYRNLCQSDSEIIYTTILKDYLAGSELNLDPVDFSNFLYYELKIRRNEGKFSLSLKEIATYVSTNYAPRPPEDENEFNGCRHPPAVKDSSRLVPRAPALPPLPEAKPKRKPGAKLKQLFWTKVKPVNINNTIWMTMQEPELDWPFLDTNFNSTTGRRGGIALKQRESISSTSKKTLVSLFDSRRTQNVAIATGKLKKSPEEIFEVVVNMDPDELTLEINETILNLLVPTAEEIATLKGYLVGGGSLDDLDFCGRLFGYFMDIEGLESRLTMQRIMLSWFDQAEVVEDQLSTIQQSAAELRDLNGLHSLQFVLSAILAVGNYLNGSTPRGQAHGYRLEILTKLKNVKQSTIARKNLLHFIIEQQASKYPEIPLFYSSWKCIWLATKISKQSLELVMEELGALLNRCIEEIDKAQLIENERIRTTLIDRLSSFITVANEKFKELCNFFEITDRSVNSIKRYLGETVLGCKTAHSTTSEEDPWQTFFQLLVKFAEMYKLGILELEDWKKAEQRLQQKSQNTVSAHIEISQFNKDSLKQVHRERSPILKGSKKTTTTTTSSGNTGKDVMEVFKERMQIIRKRNSVNYDDSDDEQSEW